MTNTEIMKGLEFTERGKVASTVKNMREIFRQDTNLCELIGYDTFSASHVLLKCPYWRNAKTFRIYDEWTDDDDAQLRIYLRENYNGFHNKELVEDYLIEESRNHEFNRVQEYFYKLPKWDNVPRAEELFIKYLGVEDTAFAREVTLNWLIGAVSRAFFAGCRYQTVLILHGKQGIGKSYILERLGGEFYISLQDAVDDSHAEDAVQRAWIVELKELASLRKAELNHIKSFLEVQQVTRRFAYQRKATTIKRHCVFAGTVNDDEFLRDHTGNRRFIILHCNNAMNTHVEGLTDEIVKQIWAEVYCKYKRKFVSGFNEDKLRLSAEVMHIAEDTAQLHVQDDGLLSEIKAFVDKKIPPRFIWQLMTREERIKFFTDGHIVFNQGELNARIRNTCAEETVQSTVDELDSFLREGADPHNVLSYTRKGEFDSWYIYGYKLRERICAAEIFNECFNANKGRATTRLIAELLPKLDGWTLGQRLRDKDTVYKDIKKPYVRIE